MQIACCVLFYSDSSSKLVYLLSNNIICISESFMQKSNIHALQWNAFWSYFTGCENVTFVIEHDLFDRSCSRKDFVVPLVQNGLDGLINEKKVLVYLSNQQGTCQLWLGGYTVYVEGCQFFSCLQGWFIIIELVFLWYLLMPRSKFAQNTNTLLSSHIFTVPSTDVIG